MIQVLRNKDIEFDTEILLFEKEFVFVLLLWERMKEKFVNQGTEEVIIN